MKVAFSIKNTSKAIRPSRDDALLFDGKEWYLTTKEDLLKDAYRLIAQAKEELEAMKQTLENTKTENANFKKEVAVQIKKLSELVEKLYTNSEVD